MNYYDIWNSFVGLQNLVIYKHTCRKSGYVLLHVVYWSIRNCSEYKNDRFTGKTHVCTYLPNLKKKNDFPKTARIGQYMYIRVDAIKFERNW